MAEDKRLAGKVPDDAEEMPEDFDPLLAQAEALPSFIKGADGNNPNVHIQNVGNAEDGGEGYAEEDEEFGGSTIDPGSFTADS